MEEIKNKTKCKSLEKTIAHEKTQSTYNSTTEKGKVENQNQTHNARKEGIAPINQKR